MLPKFESIQTARSIQRTATMLISIILWTRLADTSFVAQIELREGASGALLACTVVWGGPAAGAPSRDAAIEAAQKAMAQVGQPSILFLEKQKRSVFEASHRLQVILGGPASTNHPLASLRASKAQRLLSFCHRIWCFDET